MCVLCLVLGWQVPSSEFHNVHTVSDTPSCLMYIFRNTTEETLHSNLTSYEEEVSQYEKAKVNATGQDPQWSAATLQRYCTVLSAIRLFWAVRNCYCTSRRRVQYFRTVQKSFYTNHSAISVLLYDTITELLLKEIFVFLCEI